MLLLGRIRNKPEVDDTAADAVLSLNIISAKNMKSSHNSNRYDLQPIFRCHFIRRIKPMCLLRSSDYYVSVLALPCQAPSVSHELCWKIDFREHIVQTMANNLGFKQQRHLVDEEGGNAVLYILCVWLITALTQHFIDLIS